ncbi:MAG: glucosamine-6-phosphate deaminase [Verrucomicrobia bacterium]|nr:glucosamine-6-phosphate deaminase [Verrucomicrobiota bacterium]
MSSRQLQVDQLAVEVHSSRLELGQAAASAAAGHLREVVRRNGRARVVFACAPSQDEFLAALTAAPGIEWGRVTAFHMDEYVGLPASHAASFRSYLRRHVTARVALAAVHELAGDARVPADECRRYADLLRADPIDAVFLGIGENGHLAFNDPPVADFSDPVWVKAVELDDACRTQQVNDGCFPTFDAVPRMALTLTIPALMSARRLFAIVPGPRKARAVASALRGPVGHHCPASILRRQSHARLYLDLESARELN